MWRDFLRILTSFATNADRPIFTLQELVDATRAVIWLNGHNHEQHNDLASVRRIALDCANDFTTVGDFRVQSDANSCC